MKIAQDGIGHCTKPVIYFEGESDYQLPVHNPSLRNTGSFRAVGRILALIFTWWPLYVWFVKSCQALVASQKKEDSSLDPPPLKLQDVSDFELRMVLKEVQLVELVQIVTKALKRLKLMWFLLSLNVSS